MEGAHALGAEPRHVHQLHHRGVDRFLQFLQQRQRARLHNRLDLPRQVLPDVRQLAEVRALLNQVRHRLGQLPKGARGIPVGPDAKLVRVVEGEQVGNLLENGGDIGVMDGHGGRCVSEQGVGK